MQEIDIEAENKEIVKRYRHLLRSCKRTLEKGDKKTIREAFELSLEAHKDMRRKSGEPYIFHPLAVAQIAAEEIGLGTTSVVCALLHDTVEDTHISLADINHRFGEKVAKIIDGLTKISNVFDTETNSPQAENFRKMLLTLSDDVRVILIKLADRLHNMRTLDSMSRKNQLKIASETKYIYAPLAHRLGLYAIKTELEDLALKFTEEEQYKSIASKLLETKTQRTKYIKLFTEPIIEELEHQGFKYEIKGRPKSIYSIYNKMRKQNIPFEEVYDLFAIRVIVDSPSESEKADCWKVYSIVTDFYRPNPDRLRDWVSTPKANGYESLHTTVMGPKGRWVEVQIRSKRMDEIAEKGFAAHWKYKETGGTHSDNDFERWLQQVREILENPDSNALDFLDDFKLNLFAEEVFVFTPKGELRKLPANATALDFAFDIHTGIGSHCIGAKVNNKLVPLNHKLANGDQVEIITSSKQRPNEDWLAYVVTAKAKAKIKDILKEEKKKIAEDGREALQRKFQHQKVAFTSENINHLLSWFRLKSAIDLYYLFATDKIKKTELDVAEIISEVTDKKNVPQPDITEVRKKAKIADLKEDTILIGEDYDFDYSMAKCCNPIPGDDVFGFITVGEGIKVHRTNCPNAVGLMSNYGYRILKARWRDTPIKRGQAFLAGVKIEGIDSVGIISTITDIISKELQVNMQSITVQSNEGKFEGKIMLFIYDTSHLEELMNKIKASNQLIQVSRIDVN
ncbi:MAG: bifunctional (p)ppGpp synthetase/guanosine-3',5'-bis(diphosphate) 3'-pyrophosphohydrolase [Bacteroidia bacterium]|nr:bifunctional (p)ppGpp synthetase/guanosine-3',5'-bis(diphosphate) 3'-pyrophosphohydrolase [Bacteroidia bacterium]MBP9179085.1 bifunctional (p)ppGpp synthetase/guanosine-3',5'-bis(diphosphate) 3'-pyrophosphohydrolase [Bacteroidia bacterium]MBP9725461.1 bifunctional (p)ppGpp synthetase/guanosine-3',5'-bis(diphosphate) 3'-pyrophosphohydrolase [Bacteroidia bacterium]